MNQNDKLHGGLTPPNYENNGNELSDDELESVAGGVMTPYGECDWKKGDKVALNNPRTCSSCGKQQTTGTVYKCVIRDGYTAVTVHMDCCGESHNGIDMIGRFHKI